MCVQCRPGDKVALQWECMPRSRFAGQRLFPCPVTTVSHLMRKHRLPRLDLLKIDVEGSELDVLLGIDPADYPNIHRIVAEVHGSCDEQSTMCGPPTTVIGLLEERGYTVHTEPGFPACNTILFAIQRSKR